MPSPSSPYLSARCTPELKKKVTTRRQEANQGESTFVRVSVEEFMIHHPTPDSVIDAVIASKERAATAKRKK